MSPLIIYYWKAIFLPPGLFIVILALGLIATCWWPRIGKTVILLGIIALYLLSTPHISTLLIQPLQNKTQPLDFNHLNPQAQAIVVLTAGNTYAPEYGGAGPSPSSLARLRYAVTLYRATQLPIIIVGGQAADEKYSESKILEQILIVAFHITPFEIESQSRTTYENALNIKPILKAQHIQHFYLVDSAWHLPRALWIFHHMGLDPIPAPTDYLGYPIRPAGMIYDWEPNIMALYTSTRALYEYFGKLEYRYRYGKTAV